MLGIVHILRQQPGGGGLEMLTVAEGEGDLGQKFYDQINFINNKAI